MRSIGKLPDETQAHRFGDHLYLQDIETQVEPDGEGHWTVWVMDEDQITRAVEELETFLRDPMQARYTQAVNPARQKREEAERAEIEASRRRFSASQVFHPPWYKRIGPVTLVLTGFSVAVFILMQVNLPLVVEWLSIIRLETRDGGLYGSTEFLHDVKRGQLWRLATPIFMHSWILHIFFNMWWLLDLGAAIERRFSSHYLLLLVLVIACLSNLAEYAFSSPSFGGMSGVVFGLFGFIWMRGKFDPNAGIFMPPQTVIFLMIWFVVCLTGYVGLIANYAHAGGLIVGGLWGYVSASLANR
jgi:GlpG protein